MSFTVIKQRSFVKIKIIEFVQGKTIWKSMNFPIQGKGIKKKIKEREKIFFPNRIFFYIETMGV